MLLFLSCIFLIEKTATVEYTSITYIRYCSTFRALIRIVLAGLYLIDIRYFFVHIGSCFYLS